jgi:hypothetical protein
MASLLPIAPLIFAVCLTPGFAQTGPAGHWDGALQVPDHEVSIAVDLARDDKGAWIGTFSQTAQNVTVPLADVKVDDKSVKFRVPGYGPSAPAFDCVLETSSSLRCTVAAGGGSFPAPMKRTGEAKIELPKAGTAVAAEFEGAWEGSVDTPNGSVRLVVHFKNQPDKTVVATLDSPDQNASDLPLTDVVQQGSALEFQLRLANGGFKGALNKEATQIVGEWSQGGGSTPLVLKKSQPK